MPDTIIPVVRRPVRRTSTTPNDTKDVTSSVRKLSLGGETSKVDKSPSPLSSPAAGSLRRKSWAREKETPLPPPVETPSYEPPSIKSQYPSADKKNLPALPVAKNRAIKTSRDLDLEHKVLQWIMSIVHEKPTTDYDRFIQDGSILSKVMTSIVFNSVPLEQIEDNWGVNPALDRVKAVIREIRRYGVVDVFEPEDLIELRNIPKVTKCLAQLSKLAASDKDNLLNG